MTERARAWLAIAVMELGVSVVYRPGLLFDPDTALFGMDFWVLHLRRMEFALSHLSASSPSLPAWYPHELLGTPFWSNLQNFPWIPTRLALLAFEPASAYAVGVQLAALLAALFTFAFARSSLGWGNASAAVAGFTFACAGFFAARVTVGHLPLLEAYPALPLLLWLAERTLDGGARSLAALALATACVVLAGHPQLPAYAVSATLLYLVWVGGRRGLRGCAAMALGAGTTLFVWWPMVELLGRSTRTLALEPARNDVALPYERLPALVLPWRDGWPSAVALEPNVPFSEFPTSAYFWDTHAYVGIAPWLAVAALGVLALRRRPAPRATFVAAIGLGSLLLALPFVQTLAALVPGTYLRSAARLLYLTTFALSLAVGAVVNVWLRDALPGRSAIRVGVAAAAIVLHVFDLVDHDRPFIRERPRALRAMPNTEALFAEHLDGGRVAFDWNLAVEPSRRYDDAGFFDSILLARPYRAVLEMGDAPEGYNTQSFRASTLSARALSNLAVRFVVTPRRRDDLFKVLNELYTLYAVPAANPRAAYFSPDRIRFLSEEQMHRRLSEPGFDLGDGLMLEAADQPTSSGVSSHEKTDVDYARPDPDRIELRVDAPGPGYVRVIESWDPGWSASLDGAPARLLRADTFAMAVEVPAGSHRVGLRYATPGATRGALASGLSLAVLCIWMWRSRNASPM